MVFQENKSLREYNTFAVPAVAHRFIEINRKEDLPALFSAKDLLKLPLLVLGGGSNLLFTGDYQGTVLKMNIQGVSAEQKQELVFVEAGAGVPWNSLVIYCVDRGYAGIENLSLIPGSAGAAPIQNIGAYGVELKDVFDSLEAFDTQTGEFRRFNREECEFAYRESVFKTKYRGRFIVTSIRLKLSTVFHPNISYGAIETELQKRDIREPSLKDISQVVADIRVAKLPDPQTIGNAGSFFKNPIINSDEFERLRKKFPDVVNFSMSEGRVKVAAGWLIEQCGWKGKKVGHTGTWKNQALVLVNHGSASGKEIYDFSEQIIGSVYDKFCVILEREVNII
ncbi:UDP-N-acetylmuramate dehydrogenase [Anseongella ginsenosidimutans]|uniref:UDP-N-acetylenolpyruvoylglucosamine reductase n=1 Tax=Anseongella ginsenosidimutans TaxID=496056 RepID=A0A4R3KSY9_9SPHI|nr:UDP-N-acetylmuramate dehydrogenase [Anseongella ginsenosidimutans]QEC52292.1 UDP-N-acetylmuramate dehydrogenase [Anseongella ginsenosidimutans]TCS86851.1 UDP-N-acetylmuramate dehydrogenase [Anseongella ginsenosidimutans]